MCESDEVDDVWYGVKVKVTRCGAVGEFGGANGIQRFASRVYLKTAVAVATSAAQSCLDGERERVFETTCPRMV